jgi:MoxR-like ATPase
VLTSPEYTRQLLEQHGYFADDALSTSIFLAVRMGKPLFLEGEPGVGKTEIAKVLSAAFDAPLIRLQCYEGIDVSQAVYEWNYTRQLLALQARGEGASADVYSEAYLLKRPLLQAIDAAQDRAPVLLIDELDRADEEFESFLLELLSDFQITIPELGTLKARHRPIVILTSNRTREIHDALKRRCAYCWIDYPTREKELQIVRAKLPGIEAQLSEQIVRFVQVLRKQELYKLPGIAETIDWAEALQHLNTRTLDVQAIYRTLGLVLKYQDDVDKIRGEAAGRLLAEALA